MTTVVMTVVVVGIIAFLIRALLREIYFDRISIHSHSIKKIKEINNRYFFNNDTEIKYSFKEFCESKRAFDNFSYSSYFAQIIYEKLPEFESLIKKLELNASNYRNYIREVSSIVSRPTPVDAIKAKVPLYFYKKLEPLLFQKLEKKAPIRDTSVVIYVTYISPKGRNWYNSNHTYKLKDIKEYIEFVKQDIEHRKTKKFQRSLMTDSLRYDIMNRDNFTCQLCGATRRDGVKLHVDHIFPVSKGGKTVESNLRTLCERCNRGKGAKIETQ